LRLHAFQVLAGGIARRTLRLEFQRQAVPGFGILFGTRPRLLGTPAQ